MSAFDPKRTFAQLQPNHFESVDSPWNSGCNVPGRQFALDLMRRTKKESRIELAEGLSRLGGPRCVTTVSTASNHDRRKLAISSPRAILVRARRVRSIRRHEHSGLRPSGDRAV